jgi:TPR repeat protein
MAPTAAPAEAAALQAPDTPPVQAAPTIRQLDRDEIATLMTRAEDFMAKSDMAAARLLLQRAAEAGEARAALALGATYDPSALQAMGIVGVAPDLAKARVWYEKAAEFGSAEAGRRLSALGTGR